MGVYGEYGHCFSINCILMDISAYWTAVDVQEVLFCDCLFVDFGSQSFRGTFSAIARYNGSAKKHKMEDQKVAGSMDSDEEARRALEVGSMEEARRALEVESREKVERSLEVEAGRSLEVECKEEGRMEVDSLEKARRKLEKASEILNDMDLSQAALWIPVKALEKAATEFDSDYPFRMMEMKIHRFPASLRAGLGDQYVVPLVVAIGPYHQGLPRLQEMESVKRVAAHHFILDSGSSHEKVYEAFLSIAEKVRGLYADDAMAGIPGAGFAAMMFYDACFLLQYMGAMNPTPPKSSIDDFGEDELFPRFLFSNRASINNDIMLLENQLPWQVVEALNSFLPKPVHVDRFIATLANTFQIPQGAVGETEEPPPMSRLQPHLLGLFRLQKTGAFQPVHDGMKHGGVSVPVRATELAQIGIKLTTSKTTKLVDMGITKRAFFDDFFLPPLYLDGLRACWLVNMAALELCMTSSFSEGTASVCSYLALLAMLMSREEDVHRVRDKRFLLGELTDKQMLSFFNIITEKISPGHGYFTILADIEASKRRRWVRIMLHKFFADNFKIIAAVLSVIGVLVGIFKTLLSLDQHHQ